MLSGSEEHCTIKLLPWQQYLYEQKNDKVEIALILHISEVNISEVHSENYNNYYLVN